MAPDNPHPKRIAFFGNFGAQNMGNEYTLQAMIHNVRLRMPAAELSCICSDPEDTSARHRIPAALISYRYSREFRSRSQRAKSNPVIRTLRRLFVRLPREAIDLIRAYRTLEGITMLVMPGTGMLGDFGIGPLDLHYEILRWSVLAKLRGVKLMFVSVGAGPIAHPLSRWIVKRAISLADYRSYRDTFSKAYLKDIGFDTSRDRVYPDLAFSLPQASRPARKRSGRVVGVGLMDYYGTRASPRHGEEAYLDYLNKVTAFVSWLIGRDYEVHLLIGDASYDTRCRSDLLRMLRESGVAPRAGQIVDVPLASVEDLIEEIAQTDSVVATRFHTVLLGLMLDKPVLALSYHQKIASLMDAMGLSQYCHDVDRAQAAQLMEQFGELQRNSTVIASLVSRKASECRRALDEQYEQLFGSPQRAIPGVQ
jgi:polysaccharide pyruvyl transferase WcaK-like protein